MYLLTYLNNIYISIHQSFNYLSFEGSFGWAGEGGWEAGRRRVQAREHQVQGPIYICIYLSCHEGTDIEDDVDDPGFLQFGPRPLDSN